MKYRIEYYNSVFDNNYSIEFDDKDESLKQVESMKKLFEIKNIKLYELKEIEIN